MALTTDLFATWKIAPQFLRSRELRIVQTTGGGGNGVESALRSLVGRITPNAGVRIVDVDEVETPNTSTSQQGSVVESILRKFPGWVRTAVDSTKKYLGFAWNALKRFLPRSFSELWGMLVSAGVTLYTFDWNATDAALKRRIENNNQQMLNVAAGVAGQLAGWGAVRLVSVGLGRLFKPGVLAPGQGQDKSLNINVPVVSGAAVFAATEEESSEEMRGALKTLLTQIKRIQASNALISGMLHARANGWLGMEPIKNERPTWTVAKTVEEKIGSLPKWLQQPAENFLEAFGETLMEGGFVLAQDLDNAYYMAKLAMKDAQGPQRSVKFQPDNRSEERVFYLSGSQQQVKEEAQRLYHNEVAMQRKDIGEWVGERLEESLRTKACRRQLQIRWSSHKEPGMLSGDIPLYSHVTIPLVKENLQWREIKAAADEFQRGNPYYETTWKCFKADEYLGNLVVTGHTKNECERRMKKLKNLMPTSTDLRQPTTEFRDETDTQFTYPQKKFYPHECTMLVQKNSTEDTERRRRGRKIAAYPDQKVFRDQTKVELWTQAEPPGFTGFRPG